MKNRTKNEVHSIVKLILLIFAVSVVTPCFVYRAEGDVQQSALSPTSVKLQIELGQPWRLPFGLDIVGQPPTAIVTIAAEENPAGEFVLVSYRKGKEISRQGFTFDEKPYIARICLSAWPTEAALMVKSTPAGEFVELVRQTLPETKLEPLRPQPQDKKAKIAKTTEVLLSGSDWKLGSFPMGKGEQEHAYLPTFDDSKFRTVSVPGEVQAQIGLQGMDRFYQSEKLNSVNEKEWWYRKTFVPYREDKDKIVRLLFEGVDYFSTMWLNGEKLGESEGGVVAFSSFDISSKLRYGKENLLVVKVTCPWVPGDGRGFLEYLKGDAAFSLVFPGDDTVNFSFPPYRLGPMFNEGAGQGNAVFPMGLFRDVKLMASGTIVVDNLFAQTKKLNPDGSAILALSGRIINYGDKDISAKLEWKITPDNFKGEEVKLPAQSLTIRPGENTIGTEMAVKNPQLWWTWDTGTQNLYELTASISPATGTVTDTRKTVLGIRTIERHDDMSYWLNGQRLYLKGGFFPSEGYYLSTVKRMDYERDLGLLKAANMNSMAVLHSVENADFYDLCDRLGILVFMGLPHNQWGPLEVVYPDAPSPMATVFVQHVNHPRREIYIEEALRQFRQVIIQLRNHPSIIVWDGFAEVGDQAYGEYGKLISKLVEKLSPGTIYHPSNCDEGEHHLWAGNAGLSDLEGREFFPGYQDLFEAKAKFVSEYGSIAIPAYESLSKIMTPDELWSSKNRPRPKILNVPIDIAAYSYNTFWEYPGLLSLLNHINQFVDQEPRSLQEFIDDSQIYQAFIYKYATESFRRHKYNTIMGTRFWSFREFSPGIRFSCVDFWGVPKMAYYSLKNAQSRFAVNFAYKEALESQACGKQMSIPVWVINDFRRQVPVDVHCEIFDLKGQKLWEHDFSGTVDSDGNKEIGVVEWTTPAQPGMYILRGRASEKEGNLVAKNSIFIKVVSSTQVSIPAKEIVPNKDILSSLRVLLIGQKKFSDPIATWLTSVGVKTDVIKEETIARLGELRDAEAIRKKYDVVWLTSFSALWKLMDAEMAGGLAEAVKCGVGFIHTGGTGSFHGGNGFQALIDMRPLAEVLPVKLRNRNDVVFNSLTNIKDFRLTVSRATGWSDALKEIGLTGFNQVELKPCGREILTVEGFPLIVTGTYGQGKTAVFTGFTPASGILSQEEKEVAAAASDVTYLSKQDPETKPNAPLVLPAQYRNIFTRMLVEVGGNDIMNSYARLKSQYESGFNGSAPFFQNLKDLPETTLQLPESVQIKIDGRHASGTMSISNGSAYARLVRMCVQWNKSEGDIPFVMFSDNYFDLLANEKKSVVLDMLLPKEKMGNITGTVIVEGPNIETRLIPIRLRSN